MKIRPPGMPPADAPRGITDGVTRQTGTVTTRRKESEGVAPAQDNGPATGVAARYRKADLKDPQTLETIVRQAIEELVDNGPAAAAGLSEADRKNLVDFMSGDPVIRRRMERWLEKALP